MAFISVASKVGGGVDATGFFNVTARSLALRNFTQEEVAELYQQ